MEYIVASVGEWNKRAFQEKQNSFSGTWYFVDSPESLQTLLSSGVTPKYIFFPHWRWIVPENVLSRYECVCFHMTDVPYGRGGSPLQNLIVRGHDNTVLTALRMEKGLDTGPVYLKEPLSLEGTAEDIYIRASELIWEMIQKIIMEDPKPVAQEGSPVIFKRRTPEQSQIPKGLKASQIYDYIRMLDAPGYPRAFLEIGDYYLEFENAKLSGEEVVANVKIRVKDV